MHNPQTNNKFWLLGFLDESTHVFQHSLYPIANLLYACWCSRITLSALLLETDDYIGECEWVLLSMFLNHAWDKCQ